ncbi:MAG: glycosyltransferase family 39 protein [Anaerolineae bacterium]
MQARSPAALGACGRTPWWRRLEPPAAFEQETRRIGALGALALGLAFACLAGLYSIVNPVYEAPDEAYHYPLVRHLSWGGTWPEQSLQQQAPWHQEGCQPPLYYYLAAAVTWWVPSGNLEEAVPFYPHASVGWARSDGHANVAVHSVAQEFPYRGAVLAIHVARALSVVLGAATVWCAYGMALEVLPHRPLLALAAAAVTAFTPMFLFISAAVSNDALVTLLSTLALWQMLRMVRLPPTTGRWLGLGLLIGLATLAKTSGLGLLPLSLLVPVWLGWQRRSLRLALWGVAGICATAGLVSGWWFLRNWRLYHDPLGWTVFASLMGRRSEGFGLADLVPELQGIFMSYWGVFGWMNVVMPEWTYRVLGTLTVVAAAGLVPVAWTWLRQPVERRLAQWPLLLLLALWPLLVLAGFLRWTLLTPASQGRLLFPAIAPLSLWLALGLSGWAPRRWRAVPPLAGAALMGALALWVPAGVIAPAYTPPRWLTPEEVAAIPERLEATWDETLQLLGYRLAVSEVSPGGEVPLTLYWRARQPMQEDYTIFVHLLDKHDKVIGQRDVYPGGGALPTSRWPTGEAIADRYVVPVDAGVTAPLRLKIEIGVYRYGTGERLLVRDRSGTLIGDNLRFGEIWVR